MGVNPPSRRRQVWRGVPSESEWRLAAADFVAAGTFDGNAVHAATPAPRGPPPTRPLHSGPGAGAALLVPRSCGSHLTLFVF